MSLVVVLLVAFVFPSQYCSGSCSPPYVVVVVVVLMYRPVGVVVVVRMVAQVVS